MGGKEWLMGVVWVWLVGTVWASSLRLCREEGEGPSGVFILPGNFSAPLGVGRQVHLSAFREGVLLLGGAGAQSSERRTQWCGGGAHWCDHVTVPALPPAPPSLAAFLTSPGNSLHGNRRSALGEVAEAMGLRGSSLFPDVPPLRSFLGPLGPSPRPVRVTFSFEYLRPMWVDALGDPNGPTAPTVSSEWDPEGGGHVMAIVGGDRRSGNLQVLFPEDSPTGVQLVHGLLYGNSQDPTLKIELTRSPLRVSYTFSHLMGTHWEVWQSAENVSLGDLQNCLGEWRGAQGPTGPFPPVGVVVSDGTSWVPVGKRECVEVSFPPLPATLLLTNFMLLGVLGSLLGTLGTLGGVLWCLVGAILLRLDRRGHVRLPAWLRVAHLPLPYPSLSLFPHSL